MTIQPSTKMISLSKFGGFIADADPPIDLEVTKDHYFEIAGEGQSINIKFAGMPVGPLPMYQVKALAGMPQIDLRGTTGHLRTARAVPGERGEMAMGVLASQIGQLNEAIESCDLNQRPLTMRTYRNDCNIDAIGGIVTRAYAPLTHAQIIERMLDADGFDGAMIHRYKITPARMDFTLLLDNAKWEIDGGIKSGLRGGNGQFGDKSFTFMAMLFRLLCTNGMMDVVDSASVRRRHVGDPIDLRRDLEFILERSADLFQLSQSAMEIEVDVPGTLVELFRHNLLNRGSLRKSLERRPESLGGQQVQGNVTTLWGLSQAITAAARDYSFTQMNSMGSLAGRLVHLGVGPVLDGQHIVNDVPDDIIEEFGLAA